MVEINKIKQLVECEELIEKLNNKYLKLKAEHQRDGNYGPSQETYDKWWENSPERKILESRLEILNECYNKLKDTLK